MNTTLPVDEGFLQQIEMLQMLLKNNVAGRFGGNHKSKKYGSSCEFADFRDYMPGDEIRKIDWNAYARTNNLYMKLYLDERQLHTRIYIDASRSMTYGNGNKEVQAIRVAATLAYLSICEMDKVSIYVIKGNRVEEIISGMLGKDRYFEEIIKLNDIVFEGEAFISEALLPSTVGYGDGLSVIISDFLTDYDYETGIDYLVEKMRDVFCVQVLSREELDPKSRGKMQFYDSENSLYTYRKNINKEILRAYKLALEYIQDKLSGFLASRGANYLLAPTEMSMHDIFFDKLVDMGVVK